MTDYTVTSKKDTNAIDALHAIAELCHQRSLVIIFSDLFDDPTRLDELFQAIQHLKHNKHEVILFHVVNKKIEVDFNLENRPYNLIDMETGEQIKLQPAQIKETYVAAIENYFNEIKMRCTNYQIDFFEADINEDYEHVLVKYLLKRQKLH
jgi:dTDP-4-dehydrorhamnose reductase